MPNTGIKTENIRNVVLSSLASMLAIVSDIQGNNHANPTATATMKTAINTCITSITNA